MSIEDTTKPVPPVVVPDPMPAKPGGNMFLKILALVKSFLPSMPAWSQTLVTVLVIALLAFLHKQFPANLPPVTVSVNAVPGEQIVAVGAEVGSTEEARRDTRRIFGKIVRRKLANQLQKDGYALVGGDPAPLDSIAAWAAVNKLDDATIATAAVESGVIREGKILDGLGRLMDWLAAHQDQILAIIEFLMKILLLLA